MQLEEKWEVELAISIHPVLLQYLAQDGILGIFTKLENIEKTKGQKKAVAALGDNRSKEGHPVNGPFFYGTPFLDS